MKGWSTKPLGELCDVEGGNAAPQGDEHFKNGTIPFVRMKDLGRYHFTHNLLETDDRLTETTVVTNRLKSFEPGCILFPRSGSVALNHRAILGVRACVVSHIGVLQNLRPEITPGFLYLYLTTFDMTSLSKKTTGVDSISFADVKQILVPVPPLIQQQQIVKLLSEADDLCQLRAKANERTEALIPALFHEMFGDPNAAGHRWPTVPLETLGTIVTGNTPPRVNPEFFGDFIDWVKTNNIDANRGIVTRTAEGLSEKGASRGRVVPVGAVLITCIAGSRDLIGDAAVTDREVAINQQVNAVIPNPDTDSAFFCQQIRTLKSLIQKRATGIMTGIINKSTLASIPVIRPPLSLQREFAKRVKDIRQIEDSQVASRAGLDALFQSMLHRAFNGTL